MPALLDRLRTQYTSAQERYRALESLISDADRDPTEVERGELEALRSTMTDLQPRITESVELERSLTAGMEALATVPAGAPPARRDAPAPRRQDVPAERFRSLGDFASAVARGEVDTEQREAVQDQVLNYQMEHARALVDVTTADVPGIVPPIWIRTFADTISAAQPFIQAFSQLPLPDSGMTLTYPQIVTRPLVGRQVGGEKTEIPSRKTTITSATAGVVTYGGGEDVSVQVLQRTDPSYLGLMLDLYAEAMALVTNSDAIGQAVTAFGPAVDIGTVATAWNANLADVVADLLTASRLMPDTFVMGTDVWKAFAGAADTEGRPLFPNASPMNPLGRTSLDSTTGDVRGMTFVVDPSMDANSGIIANRSAFTSLLGAVQTLSADNVAKLGRDYAIFRFAAFITRRPDAGQLITVGV